MKYVIVYLNDSSDPIVYGSFNTLAQAEKAEIQIKSRFDNYDWRHDATLTICKINAINA